MDEPVELVSWYGDGDSREHQLADLRAELRDVDQALAGAVSTRTRGGLRAERVGLVERIRAVMAPNTVATVVDTRGPQGRVVHVTWGLDPEALR